MTNSFRIYKAVQKITLVTEKGIGLCISSLYLCLSISQVEKSIFDPKIHFLNEHQRILTATINRIGLFDDKCRLQKKTNKFAQQKHQLQLKRNQGLKLKQI